MMWLDELGLDAKLLMAGFAGGVAHAFAFKQTQPMAQVGSVVMGTVTANYLGPVAVQLGEHIGLNFGPGAWAFAVGLSAMAIIQGVASAIQSRIDRFRSSTDHAPQEKSQ